MKLGVFAVLLADRSLEEALDIAVNLGLGAVEIGSGGYSGDVHCDPFALLADDDALSRFREAIASRGLELSALSCHGNPIHPDPAIASAHHESFDRTVALAERLGVERVITFSGCPGASPDANRPSWIVSAWPPEYPEMLEWQWTEVVEPYWRAAAERCRGAGVKVAIEMHPNFVVYNPETMLRLHRVAPDVIGCNFDPSHLFWQGIDPVAAIRALRDCIFHVHAKDCRIDQQNTAVNGVLDSKSYTREIERSWVFRTVGYGNDALVWKDIISQLRLIGYDYVISIEHEDSVMSASEGLTKAVEFLKTALIREEAGAAFWA